jgi:hypothetical protein
MFYALGEELDVGYYIHAQGNYRFLIHSDYSNLTAVKLLPHLSSQCHIIIWGTPREKGTFGHIL